LGRENVREPWREVAPEELEAALSKLDRRISEPLRLQMEGIPYSEIARRLEIPTVADLRPRVDALRRPFESATVRAPRVARHRPDLELGVEASVAHGRLTGEAVGCGRTAYNREEVHR
jgi:hypothetical protein